MKKILFALFLATTNAFVQDASLASSAPAGKHPFTFQDMMKLKRVGSPVPSPDGKWVVFDCVEVDLAINKKVSHLWIASADGQGEARRLNQTPNHEERPRFSPDGTKLIWTSQATDPTQIWMGDFDSTAGKLRGQPHQITDLSTGADGAIWTGDGLKVVFLSRVYPDCKDDACNQKRDEEQKNSKVKAKIFKRLLYRHWTQFADSKRSHLFVVGATARSVGRDSVANAVGRDSVEPGRKTQSQPNPAPSSTGSRPTDLTPGDHDVPPFSLGGQDMYASSPDGQEIAFTSNLDEVEATSTNNEVFTVPIAGGSPKKLSISRGSDSTPLYSPNGKVIAWRSQARAGFESDKQALLLYDRSSAKINDPTKTFDRSVSSFVWSPDSSAIFFTAEDHGRSPIYRITHTEAPALVADFSADDLVFGGKSTLFFTRVSVQVPTEIGALDISTKSEPKAITHMNETLLAQIEMPPMEPFTFKGADNADVQGFIIKPPGFDATKKYPLKFLIHGGPQGAWGDSWSYRWNPELFAADGYVVVMINPHGSTGYGQKFTDAVSGDWGGKPYDDLMKGLDYVEQTYPFIDKNREAALGASYGGYMVNWMLGHTNRFKCFVSHDGMFNTESAYGTTEELWFPEWEFHGPPWEERELYRKWSPHLFADKFKTPTLVIHGQLDFRLDVSQGFDLFTTLQRLGVPSEMLYFPDEGHWVLKPQNGQLWYQTVNAWVDRWTKL